MLKLTPAALFTVILKKRRRRRPPMLSNYALKVTPPETAVKVLLLVQLPPMVIAPVP